MPGCEQPTITIGPLGVSRMSETSGMSRKPGNSEMVLMRCMRGVMSVSLLTRLKCAEGQAVPCGSGERGACPSK